MSKPAVTAYWWKIRENFGDALSPILISRFAYIDQIKWAPVSIANIVSTGSILEHIPSEFEGHIVGSGRLHEKSTLGFNRSKAKVLALRGPLSARGVSGEFALGDPGLLANELIDYQEKKYDLGIVPHWQDNDLARRFFHIIPSKFSCRVIYPSYDPIVVIKEIASCRRVVTSSLHGMIIADAIGGIPRRVEHCSKLDGGDFKFRDYSESIKCPLTFGKMQEPSRNRVDDVKNEIYEAFRELGGVYGEN